MGARLSGRRLLTPDQEATVRAMVASGATRDEIAQAIGTTPYILEQRIRDQLVGVKLKIGRPPGDESWVDPVGEEEELSRSSLALAPWVAQRAAEVRSGWTPERWARAEGVRRPFSLVPVPDDFTGGDDAP